MVWKALLINNSVVFCGRKLIPFSQWSIVVPPLPSKAITPLNENVPTEYQISRKSQYSFSVLIYYPHVRNSMDCFPNNYLCMFSTAKIKKVRRGGKSAIWPKWFCQKFITVLSTPPFFVWKRINLIRLFAWEILVITKLEIKNTEPNFITYISFKSWIHTRWSEFLRFPTFLVIRFLVQINGWGKKIHTCSNSAL